MENNNIEIKNEGVEEKIEKKEEECKYFTQLVGLSQTKRKLEFYIDSFKKNQVLQPLLLIGPRGVGKTLLMEEIADTIEKPMYSIPSASITFQELWDNLFVPNCGINNVIFSFDECHKLSPRIVAALLTILSPNADCVNSYTHRNQTLNFSLRSLTFLFGTTNVEILPKTLIERMCEIHLTLYNDKELGQILLKNLDKIGNSEKHIDPNILPFITDALRGSARLAVQRSIEINQYLTNKNQNWLTYSGYLDLAKTLNINPKGLTNTELAIVQTLKQGDCTMTHLGAKLNLSKKSLNGHHEDFLIKEGLMLIKNSGRSLTPKGHKYLANLDSL